MKDCNNCHKGTDAIPECLDYCNSGVECPIWEPMTNGDRLRAGTDDDLVKAFAMVHFDLKHVPDCSSYCRWPNFVCDRCPETFRNWLEDTVDESQTD